MWCAVLFNVISACVQFHDILIFFLILPFSCLRYLFCLFSFVGYVWAWYARNVIWNHLHRAKNRKRRELICSKYKTICLSSYAHRFLKCLVLSIVRLRCCCLVCKFIPSRPRCITMNALASRMNLWPDREFASVIYVFPVTVCFKHICTFLSLWYRQGFPTIQVRVKYISFSGVYLY